jgi:DNA invertase Pin-like site-specific DNA recombinase
MKRHLEQPRKIARRCKRLQRKNVDLVVLDQGIGTTTLYGRLQFNILAAMGEFERELIKERSTEGRERAIARGVKFGARPNSIQKEKPPIIKSGAFVYRKG